MISGATRIGVIGAGYVGITTAACLAHLGHDVACSDVNAERVAELERAELPIYEAGLSELVAEGLASGRLRFSTSNLSVVENAQFVFLCVPTPEGPDGDADMQYVEKAANEIASSLAPGCIVVNKSTVPVGSADFVGQLLRRKDVTVVSNPEFLSEGSAVRNFLYPDRVVIGADDHASRSRVADLFSVLNTRIVQTDPVTAETIKYASNAFLATKISFVNAIAALCEAVGADIHDVTLGMGLDPRIGQSFLQPGPGWGGSCLPKDSAALVRIGEAAGYDFSLLRGVIEVNREQFERMVAKTIRLAGGSVTNARIGFWGLTFKAGTDDLRASPALAIATRLRELGAAISAFDPAVSGPLDGFDLVDDPLTACEGAEVLVIGTEWPEFRELDMGKVAALMASPAIVDTRNLFDARALRAKGFTYQGVGIR